MEVKDVLVGESKVIVETTNDSFEYERKGDEVKGNINMSDNVVKAIESRGLDVTTGSYPKTVTRYVHDEASPHDYREVAEELNLPEDDNLVRKIADVGYEIKLEIEVTEDGKAYVKAVDGVDLESRKKLY